MNLEKFYKKNQKAIGIVMIILGILFFLNGDTGCDDEKKEGVSGSITVAGVGLIIGGAIIAFTGVGLVPGVVMVGAGIFILAFGVTSLFSAPTKIPTWGYIAGFFVLIMMTLGKKK